MGTELLGYLNNADNTTTAYCAEHPEENITFNDVNRSDTLHTVAKWWIDHTIEAHYDIAGSGDQLVGNSLIAGETVTAGPFGRNLFVKPTGSDSADGLSVANAKLTVQAAVTASASFDTVYIAPGEYAESVTIGRSVNNLTLIGMGGRGSVFIAPTTSNATAMTIHADDVTIDNVGMDGDGTGHGCVNTGRRTRIKNSKIEGGTNGLRLTMGTVAQIAANTHGKGDDLWFTDCEFAYNTTGVMLVCTDRGAITQARFRTCTFHDNTKDFDETVGSGGSADIMFRDLDVRDCTFLRLEDGTEPTAYIDLNGNNGNKGTVANSSFPTAINGGKNTVSTGLIWVSNMHTGGISTGQPS